MQFSIWDCRLASWHAYLMYCEDRKSHQCWPSYTTIGRAVDMSEKMYYPDSIVTLHKRILKSAELSYIPFHSLRHTFATAALQNGVDVKTVSSMLGHYDAGFTLRTYTHATRQKQEQAAEKMGNFLDKVM